MKTNIVSGFLALLMNSVATVVISLLLLFVSVFGVIGIMGSLSMGSGEPSSLPKLVGIMIATILVVVLILSYFGLVLNRLIVTGTRGQKESLGHALKFAAQRYIKTVLTFLIIAGVYAVGYFIIMASALVIGPLAILLGLVGLIG